jgi:predicted transcriptional regulator
MSSITIRVEDELRLRIAVAAQLVGKTSHAFILDAIAAAVEQVEIDDAFHRLADARRAKVLTTGKTVAWGDAKVYLDARAKGTQTRRPAAHKPTR